MKGTHSCRESAGRVLRSIPGMAGATLLEELSDGPTNVSLLVERDGTRYVLRLDKPEAAKLGLNRRNEYLVSAAVSSAGFAPQPVYSDPEAGVYLRRYHAGRSWADEDMVQPAKLERLARLLMKLHSLPAIGEALDPLAAARRYAAQLDSEESRSILGKAENLAGKISQASQGLVLCHNDLVCQNILEAGGLMLIDWEYAGLGHRYFDLAVVVQHHSLAPALSRGFLDAYLGHPANALEMKQLELQCDFYTCLLRLWNLRVAAI